MPRFPYMNFPFPVYKTPPKSTIGLYNSQSNNPNKANFSSLPTLNFNESPKTDYTTMPEDKNQKNKSNNNTGDYLFDLFGLKIYSDDVLLVSLIYFLYSEGVKDDGLFLVLVLLLLS